MRLTIFYFLIVVLSVSCSSNISTNVDRDQAEQTLDALLQEAMDDSNEDIRGISMTVISPDLDLHWSGAKGYDDKEKENILSVDQPFRIASVTKTYVAAAILRLHEMGKLNIDDAIGPYISKEHKLILRSGGYAPDSITFRHCLNHTSGLFDYAMGGRAYIEMCKKNPTKRWTRTEQLQHAMVSGKRVGYPGEKYRYSDTGYILAGEVIGNLMDTSYAAGLRELLRFEELALDNTWLESLEPAKSNVRPVRVYFEREDATIFDPSVDLFGGGGIMSTTNDLASFMSALGDGKIFDKPETWDLMISETVYDPNYDTDEDRRYKDYRMGLWRSDMYGMETYMHAGLWGVYQVYIPEFNTSIAINFTLGFRPRVLKKTVLLVKNLHEDLP